MDIKSIGREARGAQPSPAAPPVPAPAVQPVAKPPAPQAAIHPSVMKFGGTSVADAACLRRVAAIIADAAGAGVIVVVSALSGVTDQLVNSTTAVEWGQAAHALEALRAIRARHDAIAADLLPAPAQHAYSTHIAALVAWVEELCRRAAARDLLAAEEAAEITGLGERLAAPLLASAIAAAGQRSQAIAATELISLDARGEPNMAQTTPRCRARLRPLLRRGVVPVVTGFICRRHDTAPATLGRGGSDYSATLIAAAMAAREAVIWTDVDGVHTADPRLVPSAQPLAELSYDEAARLAQAGAKVLHPRCLEPARAAAIPIRIRSSFHPERQGTRVTNDARMSRPGLEAAAAPLGFAALPNQALVSFHDPAGAVSTHCQAQAWAALAALEGGAAYRFAPDPEVLRAAVADAQGPAALGAWRRALNLGPDDSRLRLERQVAVMSAVGWQSGTAQAGPDFIAAATTILHRAGIRCLAAGASAPPGVIGFAVPQADLPFALSALHRELLGGPKLAAAAERFPVAAGRQRGGFGHRVLKPTADPEAAVPASAPGPVPGGDPTSGEKEWRHA